MHHQTKAYKVFTVFNTLGMALLGFICVAPLINTLAVSFSSPAAASGNLVTFLPIGFTFDAYNETLGNANFIRALLIGLLRTVLGTAISLFTMTMAAYALAKEEREFKGRTAYMWIFVFTMMFSAGLVPNYILIQELHLMNTIWALVLPGAVSVFNMILLLNFFRVSVPKSLAEASSIDGAGHFRTFWSIYLPIAVPSVATVALFIMVSNWNAWFDGMIYMTDPRRYPLSTFLHTVIVLNDMSQINLDPEDIKMLSNRTVRASQVFLGAFPILIVYPFLQRYFVTGIVMGSVKE